MRTNRPSPCPLNRGFSDAKCSNQVAALTAATGLRIMKSCGPCAAPARQQIAPLLHKSNNFLWTCSALVFQVSYADAATGMPPAVAKAQRFGVIGNPVVSEGQTPLTDDDTKSLGHRGPFGFQVCSALQSPNCLSTRSLPCSGRHVGTALRRPNSRRSEPSHLLVLGTQPLQRSNVYCPLQRKDAKPVAVFGQIG